MGKLSDQHHSARRLGRRERARVKKRGRTQGACYAGGACLYSIKAGRKKWHKVYSYCIRATAHLVGESLTPNSVTSIKRPLYTMLVRLPLSTEPTT
jgi:hypothetical protein